MNDGDVEMDSHNSNKALYDVKKVSHISFLSYEIFYPAILGYGSDLNPATIIEDCCHRAVEASVIHTNKKPLYMKFLRVHFGFLSNGPNSSFISRSHHERSRMSFQSFGVCACKSTRRRGSSYAR